MKRRFKKKIFGDPDPKLEEYEFIGMNLGSIRNKLTGRKSSVFENKIRLSKLNKNDLEQIRGIKAKDLKKQYSITESKLNTLGGMLTDYKQDQLLLSDVPRKEKQKKLDKKRLNELLQDYEKAKKRRDLEGLQQNVKELKKDERSKSQRVVLDKILDDLEKGRVSKPELLKSKLNPKNKTEVDKLLTQYGHANSTQNRGLSFFKSNTKLAFIPSKLRFQELLEDFKDFRLSDMFSTMKTKMYNRKL